MKKKIINSCVALMLVFVTVFVMVGCGRNECEEIEWPDLQGGEWYGSVYVNDITQWRAEGWEFEPPWRTRTRVERDMRESFSVDVNIDIYLGTYNGAIAMIWSGNTGTDSWEFWEIEGVHFLFPGSGRRIRVWYVSQFYYFFEAHEKGIITVANLRNMAFIGRALLEMQGSS
ncbi:MAG: hypothetical protein FWE38_03230 [Firmicutes bacterium]|nr:hypothetical protein [Bacillota bacterium]